MLKNEAKDAKNLKEVSQLSLRRNGLVRKELYPCLQAKEQLESRVADLTSKVADAKKSHRSFSFSLQTL